MSWAIREGVRRLLEIKREEVRRDSNLTEWQRRDFLEEWDWLLGEIEKEQLQEGDPTAVAPTTVPE